MKNKQKKHSNEFRYLKNKLLFRIIIMIVISVAVIFFLYWFFLHGRFANWTVSLFQNTFNLSYDDALELYRDNVRDYMDIYFIIAIVLLFLVFYRFYLNWFTKYFDEINHGIDTLVNESPEDVSLSTELFATERKINTIRHTLEQRKTEARQAEQRKNDLVMYLAHDLKTPLSSVIGYLTLLKEENQISEELREKYLSISLEKAERLEDLINEFFEITRFNITNVELEYSNINLSRMLEQITYEFRPMLLEKDLKCELTATPDIMLNCDADKLERVFDNLLRNAVFYGTAGTTIRVTAEPTETSVVVKVSNEGNTIPPEKLQRIFEQFYRLDSARSSNTGGAGLGLAIAREIVTLHHGSITASSEGGVTTFEVVLPRFLQG